MGNRAWCVGIVALALATVACSDTTAPAYRYDGSWLGQVGEGGEISFTVRENGLAPLRVTFPQRTCMGVSFGWDSPAAGVGSGSFQIGSNSGETVVTGQFDSETSASGEVHIAPRCGDPAATWSWTATRQ